MESGGAVEIKLGGCFLRGFPLLRFAFGIVCVFSCCVLCRERGVEIHMVESSSAYKLQPWRFSHERKRELIWLRLEKEREMTWERRDGR